jgi:hypothetical protein
MLFPKLEIDNYDTIIGAYAKIQGRRNGQTRPFLIFEALFFP